MLKALIQTHNIVQKYLFIFLLLFGVFTSNAQDPTRFHKRIKELSEKEYNLSQDKKLVVFTGSSSIVRWKSVENDFPNYNVINNGFGGSVFQIS